MNLDATIVNAFQFCPRCGCDDFRPQSDKKFRCDNCEFIYYINACGTVVGLIQDDQGRILFTERAKPPAKGMLDLPGGFIDLHETAEAALLREIHEELNLEVVDYLFLFSQPNQYPFNLMLYHSIDFFFLCKAKDLSVVQTSDEVAAFHFLSIDQIEEKQIGFESIKRGVQIFKNNLLLH